MKRLSASLLFIFLTSLCFSLPNLTLYLWDDYEETRIAVFEIKDNLLIAEDDSVLIEDSKIKDSDGNLVGSIIEKENTIELAIFNETGESEHLFIFDSTTGFILKSTDYSFHDYEVIEYDPDSSYPLKESYYIDDKISEEYFYKKNSSDCEKYISYEDGVLEYTTFYDDSTENQKKIITYDNNNKLIGRQVTYLNNAGKTIRTERYNQNDILISKDLYNGKSFRPYESYSYFDNGKLKTALIGDSNTGEYLSKKIYDEQTGKETEYYFISFDNDGLCEISNNIYLTKSMTSYDNMKEYAIQSKTDYIDWNENYHARVTKYDYTINDDAYQYLQLIKENYLIDNNSVVLCHNNDLDFYCFKVSNFEIDVSSCYKIVLTKKPKMSLSSPVAKENYHLKINHFCNEECDIKTGYEVITKDELEGIYFNNSHLSENTKVCLKNVSPTSFGSGYAYCNPGFFRIYYGNDEKLAKKLIDSKDKKIDVYGHVNKHSGIGECIDVDWISFY